MKRTRLVARFFNSNETKTTLRILVSSPTGLVGLIISLGFVIVSLTVFLTHDYFLPYNPFAINVNLALHPPSIAHPFGTDSLGRDILSRILAASPIDAEVAFAVVGLALLLGLTTGTIAGFAGGAIEETIMRITDIFLAFPGLVLALAIAVALGPGVLNAIFALVPVWWPTYTRLSRGETLAVKSQDFVDAARASGQRAPYIIRRHIIPSILPVMLVYATLDLGAVLIVFSVLSFIGAGAQPPTPEWGLMAVSDESYLTVAPWVVVVPSLVILLVAIGFSLLGDRLRDALDPRVRSLFS